MDTLDDQSSKGGSIPTPSLQSIRIAQPLFPVEGQGSIPMSPLQFDFKICQIGIAKQLNKLWHSKLPIFRQSMAKICYTAEYKNIFYATAIWSNPSSAMINQSWVELKRFAISEDAPKNTASKMIGWMVKDIKKRYPDVYNLISYQDPTVHLGTIYKACGWVCTGLRNSGGFSNTKVRFRPKDQSPGPKIRWEKQIRPESEAIIKPPKKIPQKGLFF